MQAKSLVDRFARLFSLKKKDASEELWHDREIRFDLASQQLRPRRGEFIIASLENVEDTKGRRYEVGCLYITNLRVIWNSNKKRRFNITIGHQCIADLKYEEVLTRLKGEISVIYVLTRYAGSTFQFVFSSSEGDTQEVFESLKATVREYGATKYYRDLGIRDLVVQTEELILLKGEEVVERTDVHNLVCEEANLGVLFITNLRIVWNSSVTPNLNISVPYLQMKSAKVRDSKFGKALVIETSEKSGGYVLGFRVEPEAELERVQKEIATFKAASDQSPNFGIDSDSVRVNQGKPLGHRPISEDTSTTEHEIAEDTKGDVFAMYCADEDFGDTRAPVFNSTLGLAIEQLNDGVTIEELWNAV